MSRTRSTSEGAKGTFVERAGLLADRGRKLLVRAGARSWRVFIVRYEWSGGARYKGQPIAQGELELTPPPVIVGEGSTHKSTSGGVKEDGVILLKEISARYTESDLSILDGVKPSEEVFVEIVHDRRDGKEPKARMYVPDGAPARDPLGLQWTLRLTRAAPDRTPQGKRASWSRE